MSEHLPATINSLAISKIDPERVRAVMRESGLTGFNPFNLDKISVPGAGGLSWAVKTENGEKPMQYLDVVMIHFHMARQYYSEPYDAAHPRNAPPDCFSSDGVTGVGDPGGVCARCPLGQFGGDCLPYAYAYLLFPERRMPVKLNVPRTSLGNLERYVANLGMEGYYYNEVVTRIGLTKRERGVGSVATFTTLHPLVDDLAKVARNYAKVFAESLSYPGVRGQDQPADPTRASALASPQMTTQTRYHVCNVHCTGSSHVEPDATGTLRRVLVHIDATGRLVLDAFTVEKVETDDDIPEPSVPASPQS